MTFDSVRTTLNRAWATLKLARTTFIIVSTSFDIVRATLENYNNSKNVYKKDNFYFSITYHQYPLISCALVTTQYLSSQSYVYSNNLLQSSPVLNNQYHFYIN